MGEKVSDSTTVKASAATILDVINDLAAYPSWAEGVESVEIIATDAAGRPAKAKFAVDAKVLKVRYTLTYTYSENAVHWKLVESEQLKQLDGGYTLTPTSDDVTEVHYALEADIDMPLPGFVKKRGAKQILDTGLKGLKKRAESVA